jgi:hypothetical protein
VLRHERRLAVWANFGQLPDVLRWGHDAPYLNISRSIYSNAQYARRELEAGGEAGEGGGRGGEEGRSYAYRTYGDELFLLPQGAFVTVQILKSTFFLFIFCFAPARGVRLGTISRKYSIQ